VFFAVNRTTTNGTHTGTHPLDARHASANIDFHEPDAAGIKHRHVALICAPPNRRVQ
jgi:hypothetical protein